MTPMACRQAIERISRVLNDTMAARPQDVYKAMAGAVGCIGAAGRVTSEVRHAAVSHRYAIARMPHRPRNACPPLNLCGFVRIHCSWIRSAASPHPIWAIGLKAGPGRAGS